MNANDLIKLVVGVVVGALMLSAILVPTIGSALVTAGDEITKTNDSPVVLREVEPGDVLIGTRTVVDSVATDVWTLNGEPVIGPTGSPDTWNVGIMSDGIYLQINASINSAMGQLFDMTATTPTINFLSGGGSSGATHTITFGENTISTGTTEYPYTWAYVMCPYGEGEYCAPISGGVGYVKNSDQVILCGAYTSGELDTMYYYKDGVTYVSNSSYTMTEDIDLELTEGTTDINTATVSVKMTDGTNTEEFTPYRILLPYEVSGHADSGGLYEALDIIPMLVTVGLILGVVGVAFSRRE